MRRRIYGPRVFMKNHKEYMEKIMKRHEEFEKELIESGKRIEANNKSASEALDELDELFK